MNTIGILTNEKPIEQQQDEPHPTCIIQGDVNRSRPSPHQELKKRLPSRRSLMRKQNSWSCSQVEVSNRMLDVEATLGGFGLNDSDRSFEKRKDSSLLSPSPFSSKERKQQLLKQTQYRSPAQKKRMTPKRSKSFASRSSTKSSASSSSSASPPGNKSQNKPPRLRSKSTNDNQVNEDPRRRVSSLSTPFTPPRLRGKKPQKQLQRQQQDEELLVEQPPPQPRKTHSIVITSKTPPLRMRKGLTRRSKSSSGILMESETKTDLMDFIRLRNKSKASSSSSPANRSLGGPPGSGSSSGNTPTPSRKTTNSNNTTTCRRSSSGKNRMSKRRTNNDKNNRIQCTKEKIEKELDTNEVFRLVIYKSSMDHFHHQQAQDRLIDEEEQEQHLQRSPIAPPPLSSSPSTSPQQSNKKVSLNKFMQMKKESEELFRLSNHGESNNNNNDTKANHSWGLEGSICFSNSDFGAEDGGHTTEKRRLPRKIVDGNDRRCLKEKKDNEDDVAASEDDEVNSIDSLNLNDAVMRILPCSSGAGGGGHSSTTSLHEEMLESQQTLSLDLEDFRNHDDDDDDEDVGDNDSEDDLVVAAAAVGEDDDNEDIESKVVNQPGNNQNATEHVSGFNVIDPEGQKGIYTGMISKSSGMPCGQGRLEYIERGEIFEGQFVHGFWTGYGRCIYTNTGEDYTGFFLTGCNNNMIKHGHGVTTYKDGRVYDGTYDHGAKAEGKMTYQDGSIYVGQWSNGARNGRGTYTFPNGSVFFGEFQDDKMHGSGVLTWASGGRYVGRWKNGHRHGNGKEYRPDGSLRREGEWRGGKFMKPQTSL